MDYIYFAVCIFAIILLGAYLKGKYKYLREREGNTSPANPIDLGLIFKTWLVIIILIGFAIYFLFRN